MRDGLRYAWSWPGLLMLMGLAMLINFVLSPAFSLLPLLVSQELQGGALQLGWIEATFGVGIVAGGVALSVWGGFNKRIYTSLFALLFLGLAVLLMGIVPTGLFAGAVGAAFLVGAMQSLTNGPLHAIFQATIDPGVQGRVFTLIGSLASGMAPIGLVIAGPVADAMGVRTWYVVGGVVTIVVGFAGFFIPAVRQIEDGPGSRVINVLKELDTAVPESIA